MKTSTKVLYIFAGLSVALSGLGLVVAFGIFAFIGMPMLVLGLGLLSVGIDA